MAWFTRRRRLTIALICATCTGAIIAAAMFPRIPFASSIWTNEIAFRDAVAQKARRTAEHPEFVFLGIDEPSKRVDQVSDEELASSPALQAMRNGYPWSRDVHAEILRRLCAAGARLVMFDVIFNPNRPGDEEFAQELERCHDRVVIGANIASDRHAATGNSTFAIIPPNATLVPAQLEDDRVGYVNFFSDDDGVVRRLNYSASDSQITRLINGGDPGPSHEWDTVRESFDARALHQLGRANALPRTGAWRRIRFGRDDTYAPRPIYEVLLPATWERNYGNGAFFKDKVVIIGASSAVDHDVIATAISPTTPGPVMHLHALAAALDGEFIAETGPVAHLLLLIGAGLAAWALVTLLRNPMVVLLAVVSVSAAYVAVVLYIYNAHNLFVLALPVLGAFNISGLFSLGYDFTVERMERLRTRRTLERYVSKNLVKEIIENPGSFYNSMRGARKPATMLFSDIVGFTSMTERADPVQLVTQLNEYLTRMVAVVFENGGTLDKFIGDAVMAVWGNVSSRGVAEDAKAAARAALGMRHELTALNQRWYRDGCVPLAIGIGINQGDVLIGNIGSSGPHERLDPTVIGDSVNLASRLEALTRTYGVDILVGASASELIRDAFYLRSVARVQVKGKTEPVEVTTLIGARDEKIDPRLLEQLETYEEALRFFRGRDFVQAEALFTRFLESAPNDHLAKMYLARTREFALQPPDESWTASDVFTKK